MEREKRQNAADDTQVLRIFNTSVPQEQPGYHGPVDLLDARPKDALIDYEQEDSDDSLENLSSPDNTGVYWEPRGGSIQILTYDVATRIANLTDCYLAPEPALRRIKLTHGNVHAALQILMTLEPLLVCLYKFGDSYNRSLTGTGGLL